MRFSYLNDGYTKPFELFPQIVKLFAYQRDYNDYKLDIAGHKIRMNEQKVATIRKRCSARSFFIGGSVNEPI